MIILYEYDKICVKNQFLQKSNYDYYINRKNKCAPKCTNSAPIMHQIAPVKANI